MSGNTAQWENPYQTPESNLSEPVAADSASLYVVSTRKFIALFACTLGVYSVYWFYENWRLIKRENGGNIWPVPRSIFYIFFVFSLFQKVHRVASDKGVKVRWSVNSLAAAFIVLTLVEHVAEKISETAGLLSLLLLPLAAYILLQVQGTINESQNDAEGKSNGRFTASNYAWCSVGLLLWALIAIGAADTFGLINLE